MQNSWKDCLLTYLGFSSICLWLKMICVTLLSTGIPFQCTYLSTYLGCSSICLPMQRTYHNIPRQQQQRLFMVDDDVCHTLEFRNTTSTYATYLSTYISKSEFAFVDAAETLNACLVLFVFARDVSSETLRWRRTTFSNLHIRRTFLPQQCDQMLK